MTVGGWFGVAWCCGVMSCLPRLSADKPSFSELGEALYYEAQRADHTNLRAHLGPQAVELEGRAVICAGCHGADRQGSQEGAVAVPALSAGTLLAAKAVGPNAIRPAYNLERFTRAVTLGVDPSGRALSWAMPRFELTASEAQSLFLFLTGEQQGRQKGVSDTAVTIGLLVPSESIEHQVFAAFFGDLNVRGGIYGRRVIVTCAKETALKASTVTAAVELLDAGVLALALGVVPDRFSFDSRLEAERTAWVGPRLPSDTGTVATSVYSLFPPIERSAEVAIGSAIEMHAARAMVLIDDGSTPAKRWTVEARNVALQHSIPIAAALSSTQGETDLTPVLAAIRPPLGNAIVSFAGGPLHWKALAHHLEARGMSPPVVAPAALIGKEALLSGPPGASLAFLNWFDDETTPRFSQFLEFARRHRLPATEFERQVDAYATATLLEETLRRSGSNPTHRSFVAALQSIQSFPTAVTPSLSFSSSRHTGSTGVYLVQLTPQGLERRTELLQAKATAATP
jgi:mono/diheme cytochrome c family protein